MDTADGKPKQAEDKTEDTQQEKSSKYMDII